MEKTIANKMSLYEVLAMLVPGALIVYCVWLLKPQFWMKNLAGLWYTTNANFLYDLALGILFFALAYVAGLLNYMIIDGIWRLFRLRNNTCVIKNILQSHIDNPAGEYVKQLIKERKDKWGRETQDVCDMKSDLIQDIYYEAYTYALKRNARSDVPFLEHQVAMLKGLIVPSLWLMCALPPFNQYMWISMLGTAIVLFILAIWRQKYIVRLVLEDYEYEKRLDTTTTDKTKND